MASDGRNLPLKVPRLALLLWTCAWGIIGGSVGLNSVIKRNQLVSRIKKTVSGLLSNVKMNIDTHDLEDSGIVLAVGCAVLAAISFLWILLLLWDIFRFRKNSNSTRVPISTRSLPLQWISLAFMSIWLFACLIPVTYYAAHGSATTTAFLNGQQLPASFVQTASASLGIKANYWSMKFVRIQIIPPWFTWASCVITTVVLFLASKRRSGSDSTHAFSGDRASETEKHAGDHSPISPNSPIDKVAEHHHEHAHAPETRTGTEPAV